MRNLGAVTCIGSVGGIPIYCRGVWAADGVLTVAIVADGPAVAEQATAWHKAVESSVAHVEALGAGEPPKFPEAPGNRVLFPLGPSVLVSDEQLPRPRDNFAEVAGIDPPWESWWRFVLPSHLPTDARVIVCIPALGRGADDPVYAGPLGDILIPL